MASASRDALLRALLAFSRAADAPAVRASDDMGDLLRRGLTVTGFNLLETFVSTRLGEVAGYLNGGSVQFMDLPDALQARAIRNTLEIARGRARRMGKDLNDLRPFSRDVGTALAAVDRTLALSPYTWMWQGSNMGVSDYAAILRAFHVDRPWQALDNVAARLGFTSPDLETALSDLARERHRCAHEALYGVTSMWLRTVPVRVLTLAVALDALISVAATRLRAGERAFLEDDKAMVPPYVGLRYVQERRAGAAEVVEGRRRASRVDPDADKLFAEATSRCSSADVLVRQTITGSLVDWVVPAVS
jgi:hypothetical protein